MENKVSYKFNPYTFARVYAMKGLLLKKEEYERLFKMDPSEIIKFLQDGGYKEDINSMALRYSGVKLVENALNRHLRNVFLKLRKIAGPGIEPLMTQYLLRYDYSNLKTLLRAKVSGIKEDAITDFLLPAGKLKAETLKSLYTKQNIREIIQAAGLVSISDIKEALEKAENSKDLSEIENYLDYLYYLNTYEFAEKLPKEGTLFKEFFICEIDIYNLKLIMKKIFFRLQKKDIENYLILKTGKLSRQIIEDMLKCETLQDFFKHGRKTPYRPIFKDEKVTSLDPLMKYEIIFEEFLLQKRFLLFHQHPLTVDVILGFMFAKEIEVRNIMTIMKSKTLNIGEEYLKKLITIHM